MSQLCLCPQPVLDIMPIFSTARLIQLKSTLGNPFMHFLRGY